MKDRILAFLNSENKSYAQFAEEIGVQPSGISHILSGRNNPSLDFITKMLQKYPSLSAEWLLFGRGAMYKYVSQPTLFDAEPEIEPDKPLLPPGDTQSRVVAHTPPEETESSHELNTYDGHLTERSDKTLVKVLLIYSDKTFTQYIPG